MTQSTEETTIAAQVDLLRQGMLTADMAALESVISDAVSYGHSDGKLESKAQFIGNLQSRKYQFVTISLDDQTIQIIGDTALVRHKLRGDTNDGNIPGKINLGVLLVFQKQNSKWKLIGRQSFKLPVQS